MKTNNQTTKTTTGTQAQAPNLHSILRYWASQDKKQKPLFNLTPKAFEPQTDLYTERNRAIDTERKAKCDIDLLDNVAICASYSTLKYLISQGATQEQSTQDTEQKPTDTKSFGYNMAMELLKNLPYDIALMKTPQADKTHTDSMDLIQEVRKALYPIISLDIEINFDTVIHTVQYKNGNVKDYTLFSFACLHLRRYIESHRQKQYKKLARIIGYTDNGEPIYTTKKAPNDITDIDTLKRVKYLKQFKLTAQEQEIMLHYINGLKAVDIAPLVNMTFEATKKALYRAKQKIEPIAKQNKMIK